MQPPETKNPAADLGAGSRGGRLDDQGGDKTGEPPGPPMCCSAQGNEDICYYKYHSHTSIILI